jgi:hypothetical protein
VGDQAWAGEGVVLLLGDEMPAQHGHLALRKGESSEDGTQQTEEPATRMATRSHLPELRASARRPLTCGNMGGR